MNDLSCPTEIGAVFKKVEIIDMGQHGDGVGIVHDNYVVMIPGTEVGDVHDIVIRSIKKNFAIGEVI